MALFNYATKEITLKIVYYGPGLSGKTTNLQHLHAVLNPQTRGKLLSLATEADRTLFFDFLPVEAGKIKDFSIRFQLYTVPGQVRYNSTRKVVLKGADAVVFVADSQREMSEQNIESFTNMRENLAANNIDPDDIPVLLQYNKRDLKNIATIEELNRDINGKNYAFIEASAVTGDGVEESFGLITRLVLKSIAKKHKIEIKEPDKEVQRAAAQPEILPAKSGSEVRAEAVTVSHETAQPVTSEEQKKTGLPEKLYEAQQSMQWLEIPEEKEKEKETRGNVYGTNKDKTSSTQDRIVEEETATPVPNVHGTISVEVPLAPSLEPQIPDIESGISAEVKKARVIVTEEREIDRSNAKLDALSSEMLKVQKMVSELKGIDRSGAKLDALSSEMTKVQKMLSEIAETISALENQMKGLSQIRKERDNTNTLLRDILESLGDLKKKAKRGFKFW